MIRIFAGYDARIPIGFHTFVQSVQQTTTVPFSIIPLSLHSLRDTYNRQWDDKQTTPFAFTRFLIPWLCEYEGWALFVDGSDMVTCRDMKEIWSLRDERYAVQVVKHPDGIHANAGTKFLGQPQSDYPRKNWSSVILFNCERCTTLAPSVVNEADPAYLHRFSWLNDAMVGALPDCWNHLVGVNDERSDPAIIHYTLGVPFFEEYADCEWADVWWRFAKHAGFCSHTDEKGKVYAASGVTR